MAGKQITKNMSKELATSEMLAEILSQSSTFVLRWKATDGWPVEYVSESIRRLGYEPEELISGAVSWLEILHPKDVSRFETALKEHLERGDVEFRHDYRLFTMSGELRWISDLSRPVFDDAGRMTHLQAVLCDVTAEHAIEEGRARDAERTQEVQRTRALATLAGGVAHQFNNALSVITGHLGLIEEDYGREPNLIDQLGQMRESAERMAQLTSQLLAYARGGRYNPRCVAPSTFVAETLDMLAHTLTPAISVTTDLSDDVWPILADAHQLQMVLSALLSNAVEALPGEGHLCISTSNLDNDDEEHPYSRPGRWVCVSVRDDGDGMNEDTQKRVFEPFFSTRFQGRGLGMAAVWGIVKNHGGWLNVISSPGAGTTIEVYFPAAEHDVSRDQRRDTPISSKPTALVVDDEELVLEVYVALLDRLGFETLSSTTGAGAIEIAESYDGHIDLALIDVILPDLAAKVVYEKIAAVQPEIKALVCSGFAQEGPAQEVLDAGAGGFIQKPFNLSSLRAKLDELFLAED